MVKWQGVRGMERGGNYPLPAIFNLGEQDETAI